MGAGRVTFQVSVEQQILSSLRQLISFIMYCWFVGDQKQGWWLLRARKTSTLSQFCFYNFLEPPAHPTLCDTHALPSPLSFLLHPHPFSGWPEELQTFPWYRTIPFLSSFHKLRVYFYKTNPNMILNRIKIFNWGARHPQIMVSIEAQPLLLCMVSPQGTLSRLCSNR